MMLGLGASACLGLIAFTPLSRIWFEEISGLSPALSTFAAAPAMILAAIPALSVLLSFQRAILVKGGRTPPITWATVLEVGGTIALILLFIHGLDMIGATAAALALLLGRVLGNAYLIRPCMRR
jgi:hypothetical protein